MSQYKYFVATYTQRPIVYEVDIPYPFCAHTFILTRFVTGYLLRPLPMTKSLRITTSPVNNDKS